jgi:hypothetical protein
MSNLFFIGADRELGLQNLAFLIGASLLMLLREIPCIMYDWVLQAKLFSLL